MMILVIIFSALYMYSVCMLHSYLFLSFEKGDESLKTIEWIEVRDDNNNRLTRVVIIELGRECGEWVGGRTKLAV